MGEEKKETLARKPPSILKNAHLLTEGFTGKRSLLSPPHPLLRPSFVLAPFSARPECENSFYAGNCLFFRMKRQRVHTATIENAYRCQSGE